MLTLYKQERGTHNVFSIAGYLPSRRLQPFAMPNNIYHNEIIQHMTKRSWHLTMPHQC